MMINALPETKLKLVGLKGLLFWDHTKTKLCSNIISLSLFFPRCVLSNLSLLLWPQILVNIH